jgi:hypothetical protein
MTALRETMTKQPRENMNTFSSTPNIATMGLATLGQNQPQECAQAAPRHRVPKMTFSALLCSAREAKESETTTWIVLGVLGAVVLALSFWV